MMGKVAQVGWPGGRRQTGVVVALAVGALLATGVAVWFQPQKLPIDRRVDEAAPAAVAAAGAEAGGAVPGGPRRPATLAAGAFRSLGHPTAGRAAVLDLGAGRRLLRLENLRSSNGPDLFVYLSAAPADGPRDAFDDDFVGLGRLKGNQGARTTSSRPAWTCGGTGPWWSGAAASPTRSAPRRCG